MEKYTTLREIRTSRKLTFHADALNIFAGILDVTTIWTGQEFFWGHPCSDFDRFLCWDGMWASRRPVELFPSWSWTAWEGCIDGAGVIADVICYRLAKTTAGRQELQQISDIACVSTLENDEWTRGSERSNRVGDQKAALQGAELNNCPAM